MNVCKRCFNPDTSPLDVLEVNPELGQCSFCDRESVNQEVWDISDLTPIFESLASSYQHTELTELGCSLAERLQNDWSIFAFDSQEPQESAQSFIREVFKNSPEFAGRTRRVAPLDAIDHAQQWDKFKKEIMTINRYFPSNPPDLEYLAEVIFQNQRTIQTSTVLYRARNHDTETSHTPDEMRAPKSENCRPGRANPGGIPHLYLSLERDTAIAEVRPRPQSYVTLAHFSLIKTVSVLDLSKLTSPNPFKDLDDHREQLASWKLLKKLGTELSKPVMRGDDSNEYIPTQYLSEFVKSKGIDGILYRSSMRESGTNLVLYDEDVVAQNCGISLHKINNPEVQHELIR